ncbi:MAG: hypothetical protein HQM08_06065 [Candidatus Riflebacteria bacterium]|nr:hypothetical protein [Candidatus Riflebacteria bacterium]
MNSRIKSLIAVMILAALTIVLPVSAGSWFHNDQSDQTGKAGKLAKTFKGGQCDQGQNNQQGQSDQGQNNQGGQCDQGQNSQVGQNNQQGQVSQDMPQQEEKFKAEIKPSKKVCDVMEEYRAWMERKAKTISNFQKVQKDESSMGKGDQGGGDSGQGDQGQQGGGQCDPEQDLVALVNAKLEVVERALDHQASTGMGDYAYWKRTVQMLSIQAKLSVDILKSVITENGEKLNPMIKAAITQVTNNLDTVTGFANSKDDRWSKAAKDIAKISWESAKDLREIERGVRDGQKLWKRVFPKSSLSKTVVPCVVKAELQALQVYLTGQTVEKGDGGWSFWCRTNTYLCRVADLCSDVSRRMWTDFYWKLNKKTRENIDILRRRCDGISDKYNFKVGGQNYWKTAVEDTTGGLDNASKNITEILGALQ